MGRIIMQLIFIIGIMYGIAIFFINLKKGPAEDKYRLVLSTSIAITCAAAFLLTVKINPT